MPSSSPVGTITGSMRVAVAVLVVVVLAPGCSGNDATEDREPAAPPVAAAEAPNAAELRWIGELEEWHWITTSQAPGGCEELFDRDVGQAPSERLRSVGRDARAACVDLVRGLDLEQTALRQGDGDRLAEANELIRTSEAGLEAALKRVRSVVPDVEKPLPSVASPSPRSRTDPTLSQVATRVVGSRRRNPLLEQGGLASSLGAAGDARVRDRERSSFRPATAPGLLVFVARKLRSRHKRRGSCRRSLTNSSTSAGTTDEDVTECYAMQAMDETGSGAWPRRRGPRERCRLLVLARSLRAELRRVPLERVPGRR